MCISPLVLASRLCLFKMSFVCIAMHEQIQSLLAKIACKAHKSCDDDGQTVPDTAQNDHNTLCRVSGQTATGSQSDRRRVRILVWNPGSSEGAVNNISKPRVCLQQHVVDDISKSSIPPSRWLHCRTHCPSCRDARRRE